MNTTSISSAAMLSLLLVSGAFVASGATPQYKDVIADEAKVPQFFLPDPLFMANGQKVMDAKMWQTKRRPELVRLFEENVYGRSPGRPGGLSFEVTSNDPTALGGKATRREVTVYFTGKKDGPQMDILIYLPNQVKGPVPAFVGMNFNGNHAISTDPGIKLSQRWMRPSKEKGMVVNNHATEAARGSEASRWPVELILAHGYALATIYYGDVEPDFADGWRMGVRSVFRVNGTLRQPAPEQFPWANAGKDGVAPKGRSDDAAPDDWGAISAWAWGLSRALDYLETTKDIDAKHVAVIGHSRLGKTALWAGAHDERFALVISNDSGCGGAALKRRKFGESFERINGNFPHWFCANFKKYNDKEEELPTDAHELIALVAPRPVYVASAEKDNWADQRGEFLSAKFAQPVYDLFGKKGVGVDEMPGIDHPVGDTVMYHIRTGVHDVTTYDWEQYLTFADRQFKHPAPKK